MSLRLAIRLSSVLFLGACHSAGLYGHSPTYEPLADEERATQGVRDYDPIMYGRQPEEWRKHPSALFGVVTGRAAGTSGSAYVTMTVRRLEPRNLCDNRNDDDTCRVTVSDRDFGALHALVQLRPEDDVGAASVGAGSLLRLVGTFGEDMDPGDGGPILRANYYRHWPRGAYVTKSAAREMRQ
jgi:hypothetical protein